MKRFKEIEDLLDRIVDLANEQDNKKVLRKVTGIHRKNASVVSLFSKDEFRYGHLLPVDGPIGYLPNSVIWEVIRIGSHAPRQLRDEAREFALKAQDHLRWFFNNLAEGNSWETHLNYRGLNDDYFVGRSFDFRKDEPDEVYAIERLAANLMLFLGVRGVERCSARECDNFILLTTGHEKTLCSKSCKQKSYRDRKSAEKKEAARKKREEFFNNNGGDK